MRIVSTLILAGLTAGVLSACATPGASDSYSNDLERLAADCRERGGILVATGDHTGRAATDNVCRMTSATRIPG